MIGRKIAHYEIREMLGKGGMGEVYLASDTKLGRDVALKILPKEFSGDPERSARFEREARALASLQHPNVASIYGFDEADGVRFLIMELIEGEELSETMARGPLPISEVERLATQLAAGLEAAHDQGIVHRDLKPSNLMLGKDEQLKILDFGLASAWFGEGNGDPNATMSPTITGAMTQAGTLLGTAAYMSPEQARGKAVDRRADIWAFGVILYELLCGEQLFQGETISDTLAAVLRAEPNWKKLPVDEAPVLCPLVERCMQRGPRLRLRDIGEVRILLERGAKDGSILGLNSFGRAARPAEPVGRSNSTAWLLAVAGLMLLAGTVAGWQLLGGATNNANYHFVIPPPAGTEFDLGGDAPGPAVLSPDGRMVAFTAVSKEDRVTRMGSASC